MVEQRNTELIRENHALARLLVWLKITCSLWAINAENWTGRCN